MDLRTRRRADGGARRGPSPLLAAACVVLVLAGCLAPEPITVGPGTCPGIVEAEVRVEVEGALSGNVTLVADPQLRAMLSCIAPPDVQTLAFADGRGNGTVAAQAYDEIRLERGGTTRRVAAAFTAGEGGVLRLDASDGLRPSWNGSELRVTRNETLPSEALRDLHRYVEGPLEDEDAVVRVQVNSSWNRGLFVQAGVSADYERHPHPDRVEGFGAGGRVAVRVAGPDGTERAFVVAGWASGEDATFRPAAAGEWNVTFEARRAVEPDQLRAYTLVQLRY